MDHEQLREFAKRARELAEGINQGRGKPNEFQSVVRDEPPPRLPDVGLQGIEIHLEELARMIDAYTRRG